jgi:hypothetical protein
MYSSVTWDRSRSQEIIFTACDSSTEKQQTRQREREREREREQSSVQSVDLLCSLLCAAAESSPPERQRQLFAAVGCFCRLPSHLDSSALMTAYDGKMMSFLRHRPSYHVTLQISNILYSFRRSLLIFYLSMHLRHGH